MKEAVIEVEAGVDNPYLNIFIKDLELAGYSKYEEYDISKPTKRLYMSINFESKKYRICANSVLANNMICSHLRPIPIHWICHNFEDLITNPIDDRVMRVLNRLAYMIWEENIIKEN